MDSIKRRRPRNQKGTIYERSGSFYVRYYTRDENGKPKQASGFLGEKDNKHHSVKCKPVKDLRDKFMRQINSDVRPAQRVLINDYWTETYLPYVREQHRPSTAKGYEQLWESVLQPHFVGKVLQEYQTHHRNEFLLSLMNKKRKDGTKRFGLRTLSHVRWLASGLFSHAQDIKGLIVMNPWRGKLKIFDTVDAPAERPHYTLQEAVAVLRALEGRLDCQLVMALACFAGLRQSEIRGLKWEDFRDNRVHLSRNFVRDVEGPLKSKSSKRLVPIIAPLGRLLEAWRQKSGASTTGWLFPNERGTRPINLRDRARNNIKPVLEKAGVEWKGYHAGRHCLGTLLTGLTGTALAPKEALGHTTQAITVVFYLHHTDNTLPLAFKQLEAAVVLKQAEAN